MLTLENILTMLKKLREVYQNQLHPSDLRELNDMIEALEISVKNIEETDVPHLVQRCLNIVDLVIQTGTNVKDWMDKFLQ